MAQTVIMFTGQLLKKALPYVWPPVWAWIKRKFCEWRKKRAAAKDKAKGMIQRSKDGSTYPLKRKKGR